MKDAGANLLGRLGSIPIHRFIETYLSVFRKGIAGQFRGAVAAWTLSGAGAAFQALVVITITGAVQVASSVRAEGGAEIALFGREFDLFKVLPEFLQSASARLLVTVVLSMLFLMGATTARYVTTLVERRMARTFHQRLVHDLLNQASDCHVARYSGEEGLEALRLGALQHAIHVAKSFETLLRLPIMAMFFFDLDRIRAAESHASHVAFSSGVNALHRSAHISLWVGEGPKRCLSILRIVAVLRSTNSSRKNANRNRMGTPL